MTNGHDSSTRSRTIIGTLFTWVLLTTFASPAAVGQEVDTVDTFTAAQFINSTFTNSTVPEGATGKIIGMSRDAIYTAGGGGGSSSVLSISGNTYTYTRNASDGSFISVDWDGANTALVFDPIGLGSANLMASGANGFEFTTTVRSTTLDFKIFVHTDGSNASSATVTTSTNGTQFVCYSSFSVEKGAGANFGNVGAIQLITFGSNAQDWDIGPLKYKVVGGCSLPVELNSFDATVRGGAVSLAWSTSSETNTSGFAIEHRALAAASSEWSEVGFVDAAGNSSQTRNYAFAVDALNAGPHAFRLRVVDVDGRFDYSETIEVSVETPGSFVLGAAYPNPFNTSTSFTLALDRAQMVEISVFDLLGRRVKELHSGTLEAGQTHVFRLDATDLETGLYVIRAIGEFGQATSSVTLVK